MKMMRNVRKLIEISSSPLANSDDEMPELIRERPVGRELAALLRIKNGFFAFESALHVFPCSSDAQTYSLNQWNSRCLWCDRFRHAQGKIFFAQDLFGVQFATDGISVTSFDPETGLSSELADSLEDWAAKLLGSFRELTGHPLARLWQSQFGRLPLNSRLVPRIPFVLGGKFEIENLEVVDSVVAMHRRAELARQIEELPDGASITFRLISGAASLRGEQ